MSKDRKIPVFPNWFPFNDMVFDGHLKVGKYAAVKTRKWQWKYMGPVLFYNTLRTAQVELDRYPKYQNVPANRKTIIGIAEIVESRPLTTEEAKQMLANFNNHKLVKIEIELEETAAATGQSVEQIIYDFWKFGPFVAPFRIGFFFQNLKRFEKPIPFNWPSGPIKPIFTDVNQNPALKKQIALADY